MLHDLNDKIFTEEVQVKQENMNDSKKLLKYVQLLSIKQITEEIGQNTPIFSNWRCCN